jgi:hypothetical protein
VLRAPPVAQRVPPSLGPIRSRVPFSSLARECAPHCQRDLRGRFSPGAFGAPKGRAGPVGSTGSGPGVRADAHVRRCPQAAKCSRKVVLDVVNLTRWSFCFRRQTRLDGWAIGTNLGVYMSAKRYASTMEDKKLSNRLTDASAYGANQAMRCH